MTVLEHFFVKGILRYSHALRKTDFISLGIDFLLGLFIQLRRIREPDDNCIRLLHILLVTEQDILDQRRHDDGLSGSGWRSERNHLRRVCPVITAHCLRSLHANISKRFFLKRE